MDKNKIIALFGLLLCVSAGHAMEKESPLELKCLQVKTFDGETFCLHDDVVKEFKTLSDAWSDAKQSDNNAIQLRDIKANVFKRLLLSLDNILVDAGVYQKNCRPRIVRFCYTENNTPEQADIELSIDCLKAADYLQSSYLKRSYTYIVAQ